MIPKVSGHFDHVMWTHSTITWRCFNNGMGIDIGFVIFGCITNSRTSNRLFNGESGYFIQNYRIIFWKKDNLKQAIYLPCVIRWTLQLPKDPLKKGGWKGEKTLEKKKGKDIRKDKKEK